MTSLGQFLFGVVVAAFAAAVFLCAVCVGAARMRKGGE